MFNQKGSVTIIVSLVLLLIIAGAGVWYITSKDSPSQKLGYDPNTIETPAPLQSTATSSASVLPPVNWRTYQNQEYDFEFNYPPHYEEVEMIEKDPNLDPYKTLVVEFISNKEANTMAPESLYIYVTKPLREYTYNNNQAGIAYNFDPATKTWKSNSDVPDPTDEIKKLMPQQLNPENTIYTITYPCGGGKGIAIPQASDFVLELSVECMSSYPESEEELKNMADIREIFNKVISSFKFTN